MPPQIIFIEYLIEKATRFRIIQMHFKIENNITRFKIKKHLCKHLDN